MLYVRENVSTNTRKRQIMRIGGLLLFPYPDKDSSIVAIVISLNVTSMSANAFDNCACMNVNIAYQIMFDKNRLI